MIVIFADENLNSCVGLPCRITMKGKKPFVRETLQDGSITLEDCFEPTIIVSPQLEKHPRKNPVMKVLVKPNMIRINKNIIALARRPFLKLKRGNIYLIVIKRVAFQFSM